MRIMPRSPRRDLRPILDALESRSLLNAAFPHVHELAAEIRNHSDSSGPQLTIIDRASLDGSRFTNFDGPGGAAVAGSGTNMNGISNNGTAVGFTINNGAFNNFTANPLHSHKVKVLNINGSTTAMAFAVNSSGTVVGTDGNGNAFYLNHKGMLSTFIPTGGTSAVALGINDRGTIVGQYVTSTGTPGFVRLKNGSFITINAPAGPNIVNVQGINNHGLVVGFYVGADGQDHGFMASVTSTTSGSITGTPIADPAIPTVSGEPGATFVFSQILGINDKGLAVGYYGDSTTSQHGFLYNTKTGTYSFVDDPNVAFDQGVEVTQITGITNSGEITGFYSDAAGVFHGFVATTRGH